MSIQVGDRLPAGELREFIEVETEGCTLGPNKFNVADLTKGKKIAIFAVPGAFTPTCSEKHAPGYIQQAGEFKARGVDEIWCIAVNDPFVMGAWGRALNAGTAVRMMSDGNAEFTQALGLAADFSKGGLGTRSQRYSMLVDDGVVKKLNVEQSGKLESSDAQTLLNQLGQGA